MKSKPFFLKKEIVKVSLMNKKIFSFRAAIFLKHGGQILVGLQNQNFFLNNTKVVIIYIKKCFGMLNKFQQSKEAPEPKSLRTASLN